MNRRRWITAGAIVLVAVVALLWWRGRNAAGAPRYRTAAVDRGSIESVVSATGTIQPVEQVQVGSQVSGTVQKIYADYNARVRAGQIILQLEQSSFLAREVQAEAAVAKAEATVRDGETALQRAQELFKQSYVSQAELDAATVALQQRRADLKQARAQLQSAQVDLQHTTIRAPIDGVVIARSVDVGQTVAASLQAPQLFLIANDLRQMQVETRIDEADIGQMRPGLPVTFTVDAFPDRDFTGQVAQVRLEPITDQNVVTYTTVIRTDNPDLRLRPGMTANVTVRIERRDGVLRVPNAALRFRPPMTGERGGGAQAAGVGGGGPQGGMGGGSRMALGGQGGGGGRPGAGGGAADPASGTTRGGGAADPRAARTGNARAHWDSSAAGGAGMSEAQRAAWRARMAQATPEERQRMRDAWGAGGARARAAGAPGGDPDLVRRGPAPANARTLGVRPESAGDVNPPPEAPSYRPGTIYLLKDGKPSKAFVLTGITDGAFTELQADGVHEGDSVIIGLDQQSRSASNSLQPPPGMGGFRGPGGGGGGRGR